MQAEELLTPKELADRLKVSERTIKRSQLDGALPGRLVRGKLRFYWPEVVAALPRAPVSPSNVHRQMGAPGGDLVAMLKARAKAYRVTR